MASNKGTQIVKAVGRFLPAARIIATVGAVVAFLVFVFADNILHVRMERAIVRDLEAEGIGRNAMRFTPVEGYDQGAEIRLSTGLRDAALANDESGLWVITTGGEAIFVDLASGVITNRLRPVGMSSPTSISTAPDGRLLVADDQAGLVSYVDAEGQIELVYQRGEGQALQLSPEHPVAIGEQVFAVSGAPATGIFAFTQGTPSRLYGYANITDMVAHGDHLYITAGHEGGLPVAKLTTTGTNRLVNVDLSWAWALQFWDIPFVGLDVDDQDFMTIVDAEGQIVQLSPSARVVSQLPPARDELGPARTVVARSDGGVVVVYDQGVVVHSLSRQGSLVRQATSLTEAGEYEAALPLWTELVEQEPELLTLRRWLGWTYLATGEPHPAAKQLYLAGDKEGFDAAVDADASRLRREYLWQIWIGLMGLAAVLWVLNMAWPAFIRTASHRE